MSNINLNFYALIPAKYQSRGLPEKNITILKDKPLVAWSIEAGLKTQSIKTVFVSTESCRVAEICSRFGAQIIDRPDSLCADNTTTDAVIQHAITIIRKQVKEDDFGIVLLQPTSPLRNSIDVDQAIQVFVSSDANALVSVYPVESSLLKVYKQDDKGFLIGAFSPDTPYLPRQSLPQIYMPNGAIYIFTASQFLTAGQIPRTQVVPFIMDKERSIDIDTRDDLESVKIFLEKQDEPMA